MYIEFESVAIMNEAVCKQKKKNKNLISMEYFQKKSAFHQECF